MTDLGYGRQFADFYDRIFPGGPAAEPAVAYLADLHPGDGRSTLELGVGTGRIALPLADRVGEIVGVDSSPEMLDVLRAALKDQPRPVTPVDGDIRDWADHRSYGLVYCICGTLSMLLDPAEQQQTITAAAARLDPGGTLVVETHNPDFAVHVINQGRARDSYLIPYPGRDTGLLSYSTIDVANRIWQLTHLWIEDGRSRIASEVSRLTTAEEVDAYAENAGLILAARHSDWFGNEFTGVEPMYVSVYRHRGE
ncbi:class I SAM-dependent methyltransferase [Actinoplanes bogorensis]|uniref:Class I SAM-dependent methyltransferase n=1 Tax=Paractinoplanes bogorensis TaxID=1610840 RepID=A0ABS5YUG6_9ACTN|nr:class I SAM-dependent methyltransferase [Actinoplanes bogorensis]MBU2666319.1 class I SAM-dependent methyltransferase [Actinoplanes bogorensis]